MGAEYGTNLQFLHETILGNQAGAELLRYGSRGQRLDDTYPSYHYPRAEILDTIECTPSGISKGEDCGRTPAHRSVTSRDQQTQRALTPRGPPPHDDTRAGAAS